LNNYDRRKIGYKKNPGGHAKIKGIFGRKKLVRIFLRKEFVLSKKDEHTFNKFDENSRQLLFLAIYKNA